MVYGARLESVCSKGLVGSNPTSSAACNDDYIEMIKYSMEIDNIVNKIIAKIKMLPDGTEISTSQLMHDLSIINKYDRDRAVYIGDDFELTVKDMFLINDEVVKKVVNEKVIMDFSKYKDQMVGLPFNIPFIKKSIL